MNIVDLFCGCGGLSLGFQEAGHTIVSAFDNWDIALEVYRANFAHPCFKLDLSDVEKSVRQVEPFHPDMVIGGPPCQDFSSAGKRDEDGGRGNLTVHYAKIVSQVHPRWFVMENVATITKTRKLEEALSIFREAGYGLTQMVLDASRCGVPQARKRFVLIGKLHAVDGFIAESLSCGLTDHRMTLRDYFGDELGTEFYYRHPRSYARRGIFSIDEPCPTIRGVNRPLPKNYVPHPNDATSDLSKVRPLTTEERARIQTFPREFVFLGNKTDKEQMIGNAVPVALARYVAEAIAEYEMNHPR